MQLANKAILLYNIKTDPETGYEVYYPTLITGVSYFTRTVVGLDKSGMLAGNLHVIRVPVDADFSGKQYVAPVDFKSADPATSYTFAVGDKMLITGPTTGALYVTVDEIHDDASSIRTARQGTRVSIRVPEKVRPSDKLFKIVTV